MNRFCACTILTIALLFINASESARILAVFPVPSISHQVVFRPITQELAKRHEVVVITPDPAFPKGQAPANLTEIDVHDVSYRIFREVLVKIPMGNKGDLASQMDSLVKIFSVIFEEQIQNEDVQKLINDKNQKFDLLLIEACVKPALSFSHIYKAPVILISSLGAVLDNNHVMGVPNHPTLYPGLRPKLYNLTMWEKFNEFYYYWEVLSIVQKQEDVDNKKLTKYFGHDMPTLTDLSNNVHMMFLNMPQIWAGNYPVPPSVIFLGGLHQNPPKDLPKDIETELSSSKHGVIYFSLGTNAAPLSKEKLATLAKVFSSLPYDVFWVNRYEGLPEMANNIKIFKWLPQSDLLRHEKIKLFITQGGLQSTDETIAAGVPVIGLPMLADQWFNVEQYAHHRIGVALDMDTINEKDLTQAIKIVIEDKSYRENIRKLRSVMLDQPQKPLERAIWWIEHVLRHGGGKHLRSPIANMPLAEFIELDMVIFAICVLFFILTLILCISYFIWQNLKVRVVSKIKEKDN